jgi:hypothetical protein
MNLINYFYGWAVLAVVVVGLAVYRRIVAEHDDDLVHLADSEVGMVSQQVKIGKKIHSLDRLGITLTVIAVVYGSLLLGIYLHYVWVTSVQIHN